MLKKQNKQTNNSHDTDDSRALLRLQTRSCVLAPRSPLLADLNVILDADDDNNNNDGNVVANPFVASQRLARLAIFDEEDDVLNSDNNDNNDDDDDNNDDRQRQRRRRQQRQRANYATNSLMQCRSTEASSSLSSRAMFDVPFNASEHRQW